MINFDIFRWMVNARGNMFSHQHVNLNVSDPKYWDFSWHEIGIYDIPASIDYILNHTNQSKLAFIGDSQGAAVILVTLSEVPEYNDKVSIAQMMAPAVIFKYMHAAIPKSIKLMNLLGVSS